MSPELFQSFGPILNRSRAAGSGREKIQYIGTILILQEPESRADLSVWLSVRERPVDARNGPVSGKLVCRCIVVGLIFVVVLNFRLLPLSSPVVDASLSDEKEKMYCGPWNCGASYVSFHRSISLFLLFCGECGDAIQQQKRFKGDFPRFHKSTTTKRQRFQSFSLMSFSTNSLVKVKYLPLQF